jgi:hypothetical protein
MSEALEKLQNIGVEAIHKKTHIPSLFIEAILQKDFQKLSKIQLSGFITILQREYNVDLQELKQEAQAYYEEHEIPKEKEQSHIFISPKEPQNYTPFYIAFAILVFLIALWFTLKQPNNTQDIVAPTIEQIQLPQKIDENNGSLEKNSSISTYQSVQIKEIKEVVAIQKTAKNEKQQGDVEKEVAKNQENRKKQAPKQQQKLVHTFEIQPKVKVWLGYIDMKNYKHYQKTFQSKFALDGSKEWLLTFGHGLVTFIVDGKEQQFSSKQGLKFHYKDGKLQQLTTKEFKRFNRGRAW